MVAKAGAIGVPSVGGMKEAFTDFLYGAGGGLTFAIGRAILGTNIIGALGAPILAGSVIKGERGRTIATMAGFMALVGGLGGGVAAAEEGEAAAPMATM